MPRGGKDAYTDRQKRKAAHIEESYEARGVPREEAAARAWATVNKDEGGGRKSGSGRSRSATGAASRKEGKAPASGSPEQRSAAARKGWETRRRKAKG